MTLSRDGEPSVQPLVSIVVPVHNSAETLNQCIESICNQSLKSLQIIFVDDASTDDSYTLLQTAQKSDDRITIVRLPSSRGAGAARNAGFKRAQGEYVVFLDSDDVFDLDMLLEMSNSLNKSGADICICEADEFTGNLPSEEARRPRFRFGPEIDTGCYETMVFKKNLFQLSIPAPWNKMYRVDFVNRTGQSFQELHHANDVYFTSVALALSKRIYILKQPYVYYRIGQNGSLQDNKTIEPMCPYIAGCEIYSYLSGINILSKPLSDSAARLCFDLTSRAIAAAALSGTLSDGDLAQIRDSFLKWDIRTSGVLKDLKSKFMFNRYEELSSKAIIWAYANRTSLRGESRYSNMILAIRLLAAELICR